MAAGSSPLLNRWYRQIQIDTKMQQKPSRDCRRIRLLTTLSMTWPEALGQWQLHHTKVLGSHSFAMTGRKTQRSPLNRRQKACCCDFVKAIGKKSPMCLLTAVDVLVYHQTSKSIDFFSQF